MLALRSMCSSVGLWLQIGVYVGLFAGCVPTRPRTQPDATAFALRDTVYDARVKSVRLYPFLGGQAMSTSSPIIALGAEGYLRLEFDVLSTQQAAFYATLIPCTARWARSRVSALAFVEGINRFSLQAFRPVFHTRTPYIHYRFDVPVVRMSGNYMLLVRKDDTSKTPILSMRFMVNEGQTRITPRIMRSRRLVARGDHHRISFSLDYKGLSVPYPHRDLYVAMRQNQQWSTWREGLRPTRLRDVEYVYEYDHSNGESDFKALRGFRTFDIRRAAFRGLHVAHTLRDDAGWKVVLETDRPQGTSSFDEQRDLDGHYFPYEEGPSEADYVRVQFRLDSRRETITQGYVVGSFNLWTRGAANRLRYDSTSRLYTATLWLKEGYYDYLYSVQGQDPYVWEGYHTQAENAYEIFVYLKDASTRRDRLVGYTYVSGRP